MGETPKKPPSKPPGPKPRGRPRPQPMEQTESQVEYFHRGNSPKTRRKLAMMDDESSVSLRVPSPLKEGTKEVTPGVVGLRQATKGQPDPDEKRKRTRSMKQQLREARDERRQTMWDKLDSARKNADDRLKRYATFNPLKPAEKKPAEEAPPANEQPRRRSRRSRRGRRR